MLKSAQTRVKSAQTALKLAQMALKAAQILGPGTDISSVFNVGVDTPG
jgi:hypothetical protein